MLLYEVTASMSRVKRGLIIVLPSLYITKTDSRGKIIFRDCSFGKTRFSIAEITIWSDLGSRHKLQMQNFVHDHSPPSNLTPWPVYLINNIDIHIDTHTTCPFLYMPFFSLVIPSKSVLLNPVLSLTQQ